MLRSSDSSRSSKLFDFPIALVDLFDVRIVVEPAAARMAAQRARIEDIEEIRAAWIAMKQATGDLPCSVEADVRFHLAIFNATHNVFMQPFGVLIQAALRSSFQVTNGNSALHAKSVVRHRKLLDAVEKRNAEEAEMMMITILFQTAKDIITQTKTVSRSRNTGKSPRRRSKTYVEAG